MEEETTEKEKQQKEKTKEQERESPIAFSEQLDCGCMESGGMGE